MTINNEDLRQLEKRYRATFINSLAGYRQAVLVGTRSAAGNPNLAIFNSLLHMGSNPALYGLLVRPDTVQRDTLTNILDTQAYTLNYVRSSDFEKAHQTSAKYEPGVSEFTAVGFTEAYLSAFSAPFVQEAVVKIGMAFRERIDINLNGTILLLGSIQHIDVSEYLVGSDGFVALDKADILACAGLDAYYSPQFLGRLSYAKTDRWPTLL